MGEKDYSETPLWKKLGLKDGSCFAILNSPDGFGMTLPGGVKIFRKLTASFDVILLFATREAELKRAFARAKSFLTRAGGLWVGYPKKSSALTTNLDFGNVQQAGLDAGLVDNKSCAIDDDWSGVRFVYRIKDR